MNLAPLVAQVARFPWRTTAATLRERFREDRLGLSASSLTFTTTIALIPFITVALAVFTAFPIFGRLQSNLEGWLVQSLVPEAIARQVLGYVTQFSGRASRLGSVGLAALLASALALVFTIDRTLNAIWRVRRPRPLAQRIVLYWSVMTLGPVLLAASLSTTSWVLSSSRGLGLVASMPDMLATVIDFVEFALLALALTGIYRFVPNAPVRGRHALVGGLFAAAGIELAKRVLAWYLAKVPTYSMVYGAFATAPILLVWIYIAWLIVLFGAVIVAYLPSLLAGVHRRGGTPGWSFQLAVEALQHLRAARDTPRRGATLGQLADALRVEPLQLQPVLDALVQLDWVGRLNEAEDLADTRFILLADPERTSLEPLVGQFLLNRAPATERLWQVSGWHSLALRDVL